MSQTNKTVGAGDHFSWYVGRQTIWILDGVLHIGGMQQGNSSYQMLVFLGNAWSLDFASVPNDYRVQKDTKNRPGMVRKTFSATAHLV